MHFASPFIHNGGNLLTRQDIPGHSSLVMTRRTRRRSIWPRR